MRPIQRVFVTGATGFVGRAVVQALCAEGHLVRCLVRPGSERDLRGFEAIERVPGDVLAPHALEEAMAGCDAVVHLVGIIREHPASGATFYRVHVQGTVNVAAAAATVGARRFLHMSALGAREGARSDYHRTKWAAEEAVRSSPVPWTVFRPSVIYGPGDGFVSALARLVRRFPAIPVPDGGRQRFQPVAVEQVAQGFARALARPATVKQAFEVGGPAPVTLAELLDLVADALGRRRVVKLHAPVALVRPVARLLPWFPVTPDQLLMLQEDSVCDPTPFFAALGLTPVPLAEGLRRMLG